MNENNIDVSDVLSKSEELSQNGQTILYFAKGRNFIGLIGVADIIKETSSYAIRELQNKNLNVVMLTGDNKNVAQNIGKTLGIKNIISEVMPQDKEKEVAKLQKNGHKVAFVGDGINDSPALVKSDVSIAIGSGTDIAVESADVVLVRNDLLDVVTSIELSKNVINNIKMNLFWAFFYNVIGIPIAAGVFYMSLGLKLNPMIGAAAMSLSSVCVVTNALRIRKFKNKYSSQINKNKKINIEKERTNMKIIKIEGMQCNHCKMSVEKALSKIDGIENVEVSLEKKQATIEVNRNVSDEIIKSAIEEEGFKVIEIK